MTMTLVKTVLADSPLLEMLKSRGLLEGDRLELARSSLSESNDLPERALVKAGVVDENEIATAWAKELLLPVYQPVESPIPHATLGRLLPEKFCGSNMLIPVDIGPDTLDVAFASGRKIALVDEIQFLTGKRVRPFLASLSVVERQFESLYRLTQDLGGDSMFGIEIESKPDEESEEVLRLDQRSRRTRTGGSFGW